MFNRILLLIVILGAAVIVYLSVFGLGNVKNSTSLASATPSVAVTQPLSPTKAPQVPSDWKTYDSEAYSFTFKYHPKFTIRPSVDNTLTMYLHGPSQSEGTEVYDGIIINFQEATYTENSFKAFVEKQYQVAKNDDVIYEISDLKDVQISTYQGYEFRTSSLGSIRNIYLDAKNKKFIYISLLLEDPKNQGFENIVTTLLSTITPH
jgi:hypothetical protein